MKAPDLAKQVNAGTMSMHRADREMARRDGVAVSTAAGIAVHGRMMRP